MKKLFKKSLLSILALSTILSFSGFNNVKANERKPKIEVRSWPGRPGNPDGIGVETNTYSCTQNWVYVTSKSGEVSALIAAANHNQNVNTFILTTLLGPIAWGIPSIIIGAVALMHKSEGLPGDVYTAKTYKSSDCIKTVFTLKYRDGRYAGTRTSYAKR